ncbi:MAG: hypothetical protein RL129_1237 [Actinomycetota bacterium]
MSTKRILVAEDEALIRLDLVEMLTEAGYEVVAAASNGLEAIEFANQYKPDLTAFSQKELVDRAKDAGVMAYVVKPFTIGDLVPAMEIAMSRHLQMKSLKEEVSDLHERLETRKIIDRAKGILMQALNLTEPEAFSWIQRAAMDRRISMKAVAQAVISPDSVPER